jgi:site-specific DNA recombinase
MKAIVLARVSTEEQREAGNSLPAQQARLISYIEKSFSKTNNQKLELGKEFVFDESAYKEHRKEFNKITDYIEGFNETVALCCDKVDRLSRDFLIGLPVLERLRRDGKIELHFPSDNLVLHQNSPATDLFHYNIALALAQYYSNAISDNTKRALEQKRRNGEWTGKVRIGYLNVSLDAEKRLRKDIIIDPERGHLIHKLFELYATGNHSLESVRAEVIELGLRSLDGNKPSKMEGTPKLRHLF